ncbi:lipid A deacylase LpxR family protein [Halomonas sp. GXIMD04776]|uniref:lipid A deacylase LpxR family protein n=1 Tax=Halomonas sp. GXIMD04776 TaxID=3415605 RepID=UPI003C82F8EA
MRLSLPPLVSRSGLFLAGMLCAPFAVGANLYSIKVENDLFSSGEDGHYTNGLELTGISLPGNTHWSRKLSDWLPGWSADGLDAVGYHFIHQIYTPNDIERERLIEDDRPYAGLLLGGLSLFDDEQHDGWRTASALQLQIGWVGPAAGGESIQKAVHKVVDSKEPEGWDNQLDNEPIVSLGWSKSWWWLSRFGGLEWEYGPSASLKVGNLYDYAGAGGALRVGNGLEKSFGIPSVSPAQGGRQGFIQDAGFGWYGFLGTEGRYMAHNLLLDGNTFENSHEVERREWVGDLTAGVVFSWDRFQVAFTNVWRTREFDSQNETDQFGSITLSTWL